MGLGYENEIIDITKGEQKSPAYLAVDPDGKAKILDLLPRLEERFKDRA